MVLDPELESMNKIHAALKDLEDDAKQRVIDWAIGKFSLRGQKPSRSLKLTKYLWLPLIFKIKEVKKSLLAVR